MSRLWMEERERESEESHTIMMLYPFDFDATLRIYRVTNVKPSLNFQNVQEIFQPVHFMDLELPERTNLV